MRRLAGQAARHGGRVLHAAVQLALALVVFAAVAVGALSWRLAQGPLELPWLARRLTAAVNEEAAAHLRLGGAALAWEGFFAGVDRPLDIRLSDVTLTDAAGKTIAAVPQAAVSLAAGRLLLGRIVPRAIEIDGARVSVLRAADGTVRLDLGGASGAAEAGEPPTQGEKLPRLLAELAQRPQADRSQSGPSRWAQLRRVRIHDAAVSVVDRQLGTTWDVPALQIDLRRQAAGGVTGEAAAKLTLGDLSARLTLQAHIMEDGRETELAGALSPIDPAALARAVPRAAPLAALDAPVGISATARLGPALALEHAAVTAEVGAGTLHLGEGTAPIVAATLAVDGTLQRLEARLVRLAMAPRADGPQTTFTGHADIVHGGGGWQAEASVDLDHVAFADLPALWPAGVGGPGTRPWITENITDGMARNGHVELTLSAADDFADAAVTRVAGGLDGTDLTVHWLRPVPPITHGAVRLNFLTPDSLELTVTGGQQGGIAIHGGRVTITGLDAKDQFADIEAKLAGGVPDLLGLLREPRMNLLDRSPLPLQGAAGQFAGQVTLAQLPLRDDVRMDDLQIHTDLRLTNLRLAGVAAGRDLERGTLDLRADPNGVHVKGEADIATVPAQVALDMDFRAGPPAQVVQTVAVTANVTAPQLAGLGIDTAGMLTGSASVSARMTQRRDRRGEATVTADLARAGLDIAPLNWRKPIGQAARLDAHAQLDSGRLNAIDSLRADGDGLQVVGSAEFAGGKPTLLRLERLVFGTGTDANGELRIPQRPDEPWRVTLDGRSLDASAQLKGEPAKPGGSQAGPAYTVDARLDRVLLGQGRSIAAVVANARNDGRVMERLILTGRTGQAKPFSVAIEPQPGGRRMTATAQDAGGLLRAFNVIDDMQDGRLSVTGTYDDASPGHPLAGNAEIDDFRMRNAPALGRLLQAMTLYGLVELVQGPGLGFSKLVAPFRFQDNVIDLSEARAFSASLGMTAKGRLDLTRRTFDMQGTIVPAYFFNSLLGGIPLIGRLFSPERGGGVFAATYTLRGPFDDPAVSVNPLAALTPGFLRGLFGLFDRPATAAH